MKSQMTSIHSKNSTTKIENSHKHPFPPLSLLKYLVVSALLLLVATTPSKAQWNTVEDATALGGDCFQLTPPFANDQRGAVWNTTQMDLNEDFTLRFTANFGSIDGLGADGIAFVMHRDPDGTTAIGGAAEGIGYADYVLTPDEINPSVAVEFDTWYNGIATGDGGSNDRFRDHIAIVENADQFNPLRPIVNASSVSNNIEDGLDHEIRIEWDADNTLLSIFFDNVFRESITRDFVTTAFGGNNMVFWGFTASTGGGTNEQTVCLEAFCNESPEFQVSIGQNQGGNNIDDEEGMSVKVANECGYIVAGKTETVNGDSRMTVARTDLDGNTQWMRTYIPNIGNGIGELLDIEAVDDGYIALGWINTIGHNMIFLRLEEDGTVRWARINGNANPFEEGWDIEQMPNGDFIAVASTGFRVVLVGVDDTGTPFLENSYGINNESWLGLAVEPTDDDGDGVADDGFVVCGSKRDVLSLTNTDWLILKTDENGVLEWVETMGGTENDALLDIKQIDVNGDGLVDANEYLVGGFISDPFVNGSTRTLATTAQFSHNGLSGNAIPTTIYDDAINNSVVTGLEQLPNGGFILTGSIEENPGTPIRNAFLIETNFNRNLIWQQAYGTQGWDDWSNSVEIANDEGYCFTGGTQSFMNNDGDMYLVKTDEFGNSPCFDVQQPMGSADLFLFNIVVANVVTENYAGLQNDLTTDQTAFIDEVFCPSTKRDMSSSIDAANENTYSLFPNPVKSGADLHIAFDEPVPANTVVSLRDINGRILYTKNYDSEGQTQLTIPTTQLSVGMYHLSISTEKGISTSKVLIE